MSPSVAAFGATARAWAARLPTDLPVIVTDETGVAQAIHEAAARRLNGETFYGAILIDDPWARAAALCGPRIFASRPTPDERRAAFDELAEGNYLHDGVRITAGIDCAYETLRSLRHFNALTDATLVRSWAEYEHVARQINERRPFVETIIAPDPFLADLDIVPTGRDIVVWAPGVPAAQLAIILFAVEEMLWPVTAVCEGSLPGSRAHFVPAEQGLDALRHACAIVDANTGDPAAAIALARLGLPLVTASTSGAHEYIHGTIVYEPHRWRRIAGGVTAALGGNPVRKRSRIEPDPREALRAAAPIEVKDPPLVTIIIATYNRPRALDTTLALVQHQVERYPNIECIVINDAGEPVEEVVARYPFARLINNEKNLGMMRTFNKGLDLARGKYVNFSADDDPHYPDQIARIVYALERTGAQIAHGNQLDRNIEPDRSGGYRTTGFGTVTRGYLDRTALLANSSFAAATMLVDKRVYEELGAWDHSLKLLHDYDLLLRLAARFDFVHVNNVLLEAHHFADEKSQTQRHFSTTVDYFRELYARYPAEGRPHVEEARRKNLQWFIDVAAGRGPVWVTATPLPPSENETREPT